MTNFTIARGRSHSSSILLLILALYQGFVVNAATDYSISSFDATQNTGLTTACSAVYTKSIQSCQPSDFSAINPCSATCIQALSSLQTEAQSACKGQSMPDQSMLRYFRDGGGVNELCTSLKQVATTMATLASIIPAATSGTVTPTFALSTASSRPSSTAQASETHGVLALSKPALLAIVIAVVVAIAILFLVAIMLYRKHYR